MAAKRKDDWFVCPNCGEEVPAKALACPGCGSDDRTGWSPETECDGLDLPEADDDRPWTDDRDGARTPLPGWILAAALLLVAAFLLCMMLGWF
jgi:hypothetical protein